MSAGVKPFKTTLELTFYLFLMKPQNYVVQLTVSTKESKRKALFFLLRGATGIKTKGLVSF